MRLWGCRLLLFGWAVGLLAATWQRQQVWQSDLTLWADAAGQAPYSARAFENLGWALERYGYPGPALAAYTRAVWLGEHQAPSAPTAVPVLLARFGRIRVLARTGAIAEADRELATVSADDAQTDAARYTRAMIRLMKGRCRPLSVSSAGLAWACPTAP